MNGRERVLSLIENQPVDQVPLMPITMMFAAAHAGVKYGDYATDHRVMVEAQIQTACAYDFDYVSSISDPAREAADCGAVIKYYDDQPPAIDEEHALLTDKTALARLKTPDPLGGGRMTDRIQAVARFKERIGGEKLIEGWIEGPCAESADLRGINRLMIDFIDDPSFVKDLMDFVLEMEIPFAQRQIEAGADLIGIGDAASSLVGPAIYREHVWPYQQKMVKRVQEMGGRVRLHICGKTRKLFHEMGQLGCEIVDLDWMNPVSEARTQMGPQQTLLGPIDPVSVLKDGSPDLVYEGMAECQGEGGVRYIAGAGCEVPRGTPPENVRALTDYAHEHKPNTWDYL